MSTATLDRSEAVAVRKRPILFSSAMVRAILDGRKTQTRRVVKPQPTQPLQPYEAVVSGEVVWGHADGTGPEAGTLEYASGRLRPLAVPLVKTWRPPAQVGDRLWVREGFAYVPRTAYGGNVPSRDDPRPGHEGMCAVYRADWERSQPGQWKPSIHLPRWASRLALEVCEVRVERLQAITQADARAEGIPQTAAEAARLGLRNPAREPGYEWDNRTSAENFARLWGRINGKRAGCSWAANPYVWVIAFRVLADPARAAG